MGRIGITYQEVEKAVAELQGKQKNPTVDNIRDILGTGSKSTIARFLREWKANHGLNSNDNGSVPSELSAMVKGLWERLQNKADHQVNEYQQEADAKVSQMQQQLNQLRQSQTNLQSNIHSLEEQLHHQTEKNERLMSKLTLEQQEKTKLVERVTLLASQHQENQAENKRLHQLLKHVQKNLEHYQTATQQLRQEQSMFVEKQRNEYEQKISQLKNQVESSVTEISNYQAQNTQLNKSYETLEKKHQMLAAEYQNTYKQYEHSKIVLEKMQHDYSQLLQQDQQHAKNLEEKHHAVIELQIKSKADADKITSLKEDLSKANDKINTLRHDQQFILQEKSNLEGQLKQLQTAFSAKEKG